MQSALSEVLAKTTYIYALGADRKPQMPTKRKRHVAKLLNSGKTRIVEKVPFTDLWRCKDKLRCLKMLYCT